MQIYAAMFKKSHNQADAAAVVAVKYGDNPLSASFSSPDKHELISS